MPVDTFSGIVADLRALGKPVDAPVSTFWFETTGAIAGAILAGGAGLGSVPVALTVALLGGSLLVIPKYTKEKNARHARITKAMLGVALPLFAFMLLPPFLLIEWNTVFNHQDMECLWR
jgi:hypothetical protein